MPLYAITSNIWQSNEEWDWIYTNINTSFSLPKTHEETKNLSSCEWISMFGYRSLSLSKVKYMRFEAMHISVTYNSLPHNK